jgi:oligoendopeptidase F
MSYLAGPALLRARLAAEKGKFRMSSPAEPRSHRSVVFAPAAVAEAPAVAETSAAAAAAPPSYGVSGWDLQELLPSAEQGAVAALLARIEARVSELEAQRPKLHPEMDPAELVNTLRLFENVLDDIDCLGGYANLWFSADTQQAEAVAFRNQVRTLLASTQNRFLFLELWWKELDDEQARRLEPQGPENADFRHFLGELRRFKPYTLDESSEKIVNLKNANGIDAVLTLYSMITNRMEFELEVDGEEQTLTEGELRSLFFSPDYDLRARVYQSLSAGYEKEATVLAQIYASRVRDWHSEYVELRGFPSPISVRNLGNDISDQAVDTMLDVVYRNTSLFQDYFRVKGQWLGIGAMRRYDLYAPLAASTSYLSYGDAVSQVLTTLHRFDGRFGELAEKVFRERHIDGEIRKGKRGGAFCATVVPRLTPYVLVNYTGRYRDVSTLAHELGHAVHSQLASHHSLLTQHPPLPLAETASVFCEILMTDRMLQETKDPMARREMLAAAVDDIYATVMRQTWFVRFEIEAHQAIIENKSAEDLFVLYERNLREQFGTSMALAPEFRYEWLSIPHIYNTPFYCYAYSFGQLLVLALYRRYQQEGPAFIPGYVRLLGYGGSRSPAEALAEMDIDIADPNFWQGGFDVVRDMIAELKSLEIR